MHRAAAMASVVLLMGACESTPTGREPVLAPSPASLFLPAPDTAFRLSAEDRASLHPGYDPGAVEELLQWMPAEYRAEVLDSFRWSTLAPRGEKVAVGEVTFDVDHPQVREIARRLVPRPRRTGAPGGEPEP